MNFAVPFSLNLYDWLWLHTCFTWGERERESSSSKLSRQSVAVSLLLSLFVGEGVRASLLHLNNREFSFTLVSPSAFSLSLSLSLSLYFSSMFTQSDWICVHSIQWFSGFPSLDSPSNNMNSLLSREPNILLALVMSNYTHHDNHGPPVALFISVCRLLIPYFLRVLVRGLTQYNRVE
jgi:hypothetical protein